jgi:phage repressor protein C with HTH and peptisase S24 domain
MTTLKAAAGAFSDEQFHGDFFPDDAVESWVEFDWPKPFQEGMFVAQVQGKSMEPRIGDGAWCLFGPPPAGSRNGKILLVAHSGVTDPASGGHYTVKRYRSEKVSAEEAGWEHSVIHLEPLNSDFQPTRLTPEDEGDVWVVGEFLGVIE